MRVRLPLAELIKGTARIRSINGSWRAPSMEMASATVSTASRRAAPCRWAIFA
ncbi:MAG: hypothetical protein HY765_08610 [Rhodomicrobium sp.]|nr:hypothetical protein [Rhodomicrobium sp.]